jgi:hypothetical protein
MKSHSIDPFQANTTIEGFVKRAHISVEEEKQTARDPSKSLITGQITCFMYEDRILICFFLIFKFYGTS